MGKIYYRNFYDKVCYSERDYTWSYVISGERKYRTRALDIEITPWEMIHFGKWVTVASGFTSDEVVPREDTPFTWVKRKTTLTQIKNFSWFAKWGAKIAFLFKRKKYREICASQMNDLRRGLTANENFVRLFSKACLTKSATQHKIAVESKLNVIEY